MVQNDTANMPTNGALNSKSIRVGVVLWPGPDGIGGAELNVLNQHITCRDRNEVTTDSDPRRRCSLPRDGEIATSNIDFILQHDVTGDLEDNNSRPR